MPPICLPTEGTHFLCEVLGGAFSPRAEHAEVRRRFYPHVDALALPCWHVRCYAYMYELTLPLTVRSSAWCRLRPATVGAPRPHV